MPATGSSGKWQATDCPAASSRMAGSSSAQRGSARGHRVRNRQPLGGLIGDGGSPRMVFLARACGLPGTESSSARV